MHNGGPMVSSDLTFLTIGVDLTFLTIGVKDLNIKPRALCRSHLNISFLKFSIIKLYQETNTKSKMEEKSLPSVCNM
jgi:hypothetical protein